MPRASHDEEYETVISVSPDGGYGWCIVVVAFCGCVLRDGVAFSLYLYRDPMAEDLKVAPHHIATTLSIYYALNYFLGPLVSGLCNRFGFRIILIIGALITSGAFFACYFVTDVMYFYLVFGVLGGVGGGVLFIPISIPVNFWFDKKRPVAVGLSSSGSGLGSLIVPLASQRLMKEFGYRVTFLFHGGLLSIIIILAVFLRPMKNLDVEVEHDEKRNTWSTTVVASGGGRTNRSRFGESPTAMKALSQSKYRLAGGARGAPTEQVPRDRRLPRPRASSVFSYTAPPPWKCCMCCRHCKLGGQSNRNRPMYRSDIFYQGSVYRLRDQVKTGDKVSYAMSVTRLPRRREIDEERDRTCVCCPEATLRTFVTMFDFSLFKSFPFVLFCFSTFFYSGGALVPFIYISDRNIQPYLTIEQMNWLVPTIGIGHFLGRILSGFLLQCFPYIRAHTVSTTLIFIASALNLSEVWLQTITFQFAFSFFFGLCYGLYIAMRSLILVDYLGVEKLTSAIGLMLTFAGMGNLISVSVADFTRRITNNKKGFFIWTCTSFLISAVLQLSMRIRKPLYVK